MHKTKTICAAALATTAALLFTAGAASAAEVGTGLSGALRIKCFGANGCKGQGGCASTANACRGHNACKGQGFELLDQRSCVDRLGRG